MGTGCRHGCMGATVTPGRCPKNCAASCRTQPVKQWPTKGESPGNGPVRARARGSQLRNPLLGQQLRPCTQGTGWRLTMTGRAGKLRSTRAHARGGVLRRWQICRRVRACAHEAPATKTRPAAVPGSSFLGSNSNLPNNW